MSSVNRPSELIAIYDAISSGRMPMHAGRKLRVWAQRDIPAFFKKNGIRWRPGCKTG